MPEPKALSNSMSEAAEAAWIREYRTQRRKCDEESGVLRNIIKRAKADGMNTAAMLTAVKKTKLDTDEVIATMRDEIRYAGLLRIEIPQDRLFDGWQDNLSAMSSEEDQKWDAEDNGYRAGRLGTPIDDAPFPPGSPFHVIWVKAWHVGQAAIARELGPDTKVASASKVRPKRTEDVQESLPVPSAPAKRGRKPGPGNGTARRQAGMSASTTH